VKELVPEGEKRKDTMEEGGEKGSFF